MGGPDLMGMTLHRFKKVSEHPSVQMALVTFFRTGKSIYLHGICRINKTSTFNKGD